MRKALQSGVLDVNKEDEEIRKDLEKIKVTMNDFLEAMREIVPARLGRFTLRFLRSGGAILAALRRLSRSLGSH